MEIAKIILDYIQVIIYPLIILIVLLTFRKEIRLLLSGKLTAKYKDLTITIEKQAKDLIASEERAKLVAEKIDKLSKSNYDEVTRSSRSAHVSEKDTIGQSIKLLNLSASEYSLIDYIMQKNNKRIQTIEFIENLVGPIREMESWRFYGVKSSVENSLLSLKKRGLISEDKEGYYISDPSLLDYFKEDKR